VRPPRPDLDWRLVIAGDGARDRAAADALEAQIAARGLGTRVRMRGAVGEGELDALHRDADLFVLASRHEGYGMAFTAAISQRPFLGSPRSAAKQAPAAPASLDAVDYDDQGNIVFSGRATPGATARLYVDNALAGDAKAGDDGHWSFAGKAPISTGVHNLRLDGLDQTGAVVNRVEVPFFREEPKKVATTEAPPATTTTTTSSNTETASASPEIPKPKDGRVVIQPGNNLWRISTVIYGEGTKYTVIYEANKALIRNPDLIYPGQVFMTPDVVPPEKIDPTRHDPLKAGEAGTGAQ
jgi:nucleoid-associated protein YgaU